MAYKEFIILDDRKLKIYKRRSSKNIRLTIDGEGQIKVSIPLWAAYRHGLDFAMSKASWITKQPKTANLLKPNQSVGKAHHLVFMPCDSSSASYSIKDSQITIKHPLAHQYFDKSVQKKAQLAATEALRKQALSLLPQRLNSLSSRFNLPYSGLQVKKMKSRWGSCDSKKNIVLNLYLMLLPWHLIDYVLVHELVHTRVLKHGPEFWQEMDKYLDNHKQLRKEIRTYRPYPSSLGP